MEQNPISGVGLGVQPWPKRPSTMIPPLSNCSEGAESSFQMCKKPYLMNHGNSGIGSSLTKTYFQSSGAKSTLPMAKDDTTHDKQTQNPPPQSLGGVASGSSADENGSVQAEIVDGVQVRLGRNIDPNIDPKKLKRIISNRVSAQKSRIKKIQYVTDLERRLKALESQIALLSPQVDIYKNQQRLLQLEQKSLNQKMNTVNNKKILRDVEIEENKEEVQKMRQLLLQLQQQQMHAQARMFNWETGMEQMEYPNFNQSSVGPMVSVNINQAVNGENTAEVHRLKQLNLTQQLEQQQHEQAWMPSWELALGQMVNPSLNQSETQQKVNVGVMDPMQNYSTFNSDPRNFFV